MYGWFFGLVMLGTCTVAASAEYQVDVNLGHRRDSLRWNIASDNSGTAVPNVLSELTWKEVSSIQLSMAFRATTANGLDMRLSGEYGEIYDGKNQDSDYAGDHRTFEFSRSNNETEGDNVWDISGAIGYRFEFPEDRFSFATLIGYSRHAQNLRITNGNQTIPATGSFSDLNSTYRARWQSNWLGAEIEWDVWPEARGFLRLEYHWAVDYRAEANWNLRTDFAHPKSFEHRADGKGTTITFGAQNVPAFGRWKSRFDFTYRHWQTDPGTDETFFADDTSGITRLNEVDWKAWSISGGLELHF